MKLIRSIAKLLAQGVTLNIRVTGTAEKVQIDILGGAPKENKANIPLPAITLMGSPEEVDEKLEAYMENYCDSAVRTAQVISDVDAQLRQAEEDAKAAAKAALDAKKAKPASKPTLKKPTTPSAGLAGDDEDNDSGDDGGGADGEAKTTLDTASGVGGPSAQTHNDQGGTSKAAPASGTHPALELDLF